MFLQLASLYNSITIRRTRAVPVRRSSGSYNVILPSFGFAARSIYSTIIPVRYTVVTVVFFIDFLRLFALFAGPLSFFASHITHEGHF